MTMVDAAINFVCHNSGDRIASKSPIGGGGGKIPEVSADFYALFFFFF